MKKTPPDLAAPLPHFPFARQNGYEPSAENARLRSECPVSKVALFDGREAWIVAKHRDVVAVLDGDDVSAVSMTARRNL